MSKAGKLIKGLGSGKVVSGIKLRPVRQLATEPQEQVKTCKKNTKRLQKNNLQPIGPKTVTIMGLAWKRSLPAVLIHWGTEAQETQRAARSAHNCTRKVPKPQNLQKRSLRPFWKSYAVLGRQWDSPGQSE